MTDNASSRGYEETLKESLSAAMDGEATELELRRVLSGLDQSPELRSSWSRYHAVGNAMRGEASALGSVDLSASISELIQDEPAHKQPSQLGKRVWPQLGRVAVAATVAAMAIFVGTYTIDQGPSVGQGPQVAEAAEANGAPSEAVVSPAVNLPMGYGVDGLSVRTVGNEGSVTQSTQAPVIFVPREREEVMVANPAIEEYLRQLMAEHANAGAGAEGSMPFERVPRIEDESQPAQTGEQ